VNRRNLVGRNGGMAAWAALNGRFTALARVGIFVANKFPLTTQCLTRAETAAALARLGSDERRAPDCQAWNNLYSFQSGRELPLKVIIRDCQVMDSDCATRQYLTGSLASASRKATVLPYDCSLIRHERHEGNRAHE
jgi:hypothetical protein